MASYADEGVLKSTTVDDDTDQNDTMADADDDDFMDEDEEQEDVDKKFYENYEFEKEFLHFDDASSDELKVEWNKSSRQPRDDCLTRWFVCKFPGCKKRVKLEMERLPSTKCELFASDRPHVHD
jgi:hypothetical protein